MVLAGALHGAAPPAAAVRGLPFSRVYSLEDIGYVPRGSRLSFDPFGRLAVVHDGVYSVLNDTTWLNLADQTEGTRVAVSNVAVGRDGKIYYGSLGSWGRAEIRSDGKLHARSLVPISPPAWTQASAFYEVLATADGVFFANRSGVVFWDARHEQTQFFELVGPSRMFRAGERIFVSCFRQPVQYIDIDEGTARPMPSPILDGAGDNVVEFATDLDERRALLSLLDGRLMVSDGVHTTEWPGQVHCPRGSRISALRRLADGNIAISITERGVFVLSPTGELLTSLTIPQYHRVSDLVSREPGVLWLINEDSIEKVLYGSGLTWFGQRLGLELGWPLVANWNGRLMVASLGRLYEAVPTAPGTPAHFAEIDGPSSIGAWALAGWHRHLLIGNKQAVYAMAEDRNFRPVASFDGLTHLVMVAEGQCYAIGSDAIALLSWDGSRWIEPVPRIAGVRNASVVHRAGLSAWIEMGGEGVARVSRRGDRLDVKIVHNESWTKSLWVNVGVIGDVVVLSAGRNERRFFSEPAGDWCEQPELDALLSRSPQWLARVRGDATGNLWATHNEGVVRFTPQGSGYEMDALTYDLINDRYPVVQVLPDDEVWVSASSSLYHVEKSAAIDRRPLSQPVLVSLMDARHNVELLTAAAATAAPLRLGYERNNLTFRFFSGSYAWRRTPVYEFRLQPNEPWSTLDTGSLLRFPNLYEGRYQLQVRIAGQPGVPGEPLDLPFEILPPWHRTWPAYTLYTIAALFATLGLIRWSGHLARKRNQALAQLVRDRTSQLESTMQKLEEEARTTATLAERNRLAGEIHDSVQQGLSGAILQLDTTLTLPSVGGQLRARLGVVRNMVSYARQEVQHAVWDMDSPLLEGNDLGEALRQLTSYVVSGTIQPHVTVTGTPVDLPRADTHHLLRIAQEAMTNAARHADAHEIVLRLDYRPDAVVLTICDDGRGFQPDAVLTQPGHFGLRGMRNRAKKLSGVLTIKSTPDRGTVVEINVPRVSASSP